MQPNQPPAAPALPRQIHLASMLLIINLALSVVVAILYVVDRHGVIRTVREQNPRMSLATARRSVTAQAWTRAGVAIIVGGIYIFLISRLRQGKRWAWRRLVWLSIVGSIGLVFLLIQPYPVAFKVEQVLQLIVLVSMAVCVLHPDVRRHYAKG